MRTILEKFLSLGSFTICGALFLICQIIQSSASCEELGSRIQGEQARTFLCESGICINTPVTVIHTNNMNYLGYYRPQNRQIWIDSHLDPIEEQLTLVHEYIHVFRKEHNTQEARWLEEGLAKFWEYKYSHVWPQSYNLRFSKNPIFRLSENEAFYGRNGDGYISSFFLVIYLYQHFGGDQLIQKLMSSNLSGWDNIIFSIQELIKERVVSIPTELITKKNILRHLAVALWTNDPYAAKYALFFMDPNFEPAASSSKYSHDLSASHQSGDDSLIIYSSSFKNESSENFVITKIEPFEIKPAKASSTGNVFIRIENYSN